MEFEVMVDADTLREQVKDGFTGIEIGAPVDTFGGARGEKNARTFEVSGYPFLARKPG
jgi:hypothetical protein